MTAAPQSSSTRSPAKPRQRPRAAQAKISPKARRLAKEHGVDLSLLRGSGPGGEILATDIMAVVEAGALPLKPRLLRQSWKP